VTITIAEFAADLLDSVNMKPTPNRLQAVIGWCACEGGGVKNRAFYNPLNTTRDARGAVSINSVGVKAYQTYEQGLDLTAQTLELTIYWKVRNALRGNFDPDEILAEIGKSQWGTHPHWSAASLQYYGAFVLLERPDTVHTDSTPYPTLRQGMRGGEVKLLQSVLRLRLSTASKLNKDGIFGKETRAAVMRYQQKHSLACDGVVGPMTWRSLNVYNI
jgi:hypothetical protein